MALVKCVECERKISTLADSCPHCGAPLKHSTESDDSESGGGDSSGCILKLFLIVVVVGLIYLLGKKHIDPYLLKFKDKIIKDSGSSSPGGKRGGDEAPDILRRKSPEAIENESKKEPVDPNMGEKITKNLLHPKEDPNTDSTKDEEPPDILGTKKPDPDAAGDPDAGTKEPVKPDTVPEKVEPVPPEKQPEPAEKTPDKPDEATKVKEPAPSDPLLAAAEKLKLKIVGKAVRGADGMLVVTVNENWPMLSNDQKKEAASAVYDLWVENGGSTIEFRNGKGDKVATMNLSTKLIHGKVSFIIHETK